MLHPGKSRIELGYEAVKIARSLEPGRTLRQSPPYQLLRSAPQPPKPHRVSLHNLNSNVMFKWIKDPWIKSRIPNDAYGLSLF